MLNTLQSLNIILQNHRVNPAYHKILVKHPDLVTDITNTTKFLSPLPDPKQDMYQRIVCIKDGITTCPTCIVCGTSLTYKFTRKYFGEFCSPKCAGPTCNARSRVSMLDKYGEPTPQNIPAIKQKTRDTLQSRYGATSFTGSSMFREKTKATILSKYGVTSISHRNIPIDVLTDTYDTNLLSKLNKTLNLQDISCFMGVSASLIQKRFTILGLTPLSHSVSSPHRQIEAFLQDELCEVDIQRNVTGLFDNGREVDIYIPSHNIAVEVNGVHWHSEIHGQKHRTYHSNKTKDLSNINIRLVHIWDQEWICNNEMVKSRLRAIVGTTPNRVYARKCTIRVVSVKNRRSFFINNHIQGDTAAVECYGLYYQDELVAAMSFCKPRFAKQYQYELLRFANKQNTSVVGGASRLFQHFIKMHNPDTIISYSDRRWNTGNVYQQIGMTYSHTSPPNYKYFRVGHTNVLLSRQRFQKAKLRNMLSYADNKTEWTIMQQEGYDRIWDCGNDAFVWDNQSNRL